MTPNTYTQPVTQADSRPWLAALITATVLGEYRLLLQSAYLTRWAGAQDASLIDVIWDRLSRERSSVVYCFSLSEQFLFLIHAAPIQVRKSLRTLAIPVAEHARAYGWIRPKQ